MTGSICALFLVKGAMVAQLSQIGPNWWRVTRSAPGQPRVALNSDSEAPKNAKVLSKPVHLRELVSEVNKMLAA